MGFNSGFKGLTQIENCNGGVFPNGIIFIPGFVKYVNLFSVKGGGGGVVNDQKKQHADLSLFELRRKNQCQHWYRVAGWVVSDYTRHTHFKKVRRI